MVWGCTCQLWAASLGSCQTVDLQQVELTGPRNTCTTTEHPSSVPTEAATGETNPSMQEMSSILDSRDPLGCTR